MPSGPGDVLFLVLDGLLDFLNGGWVSKGFSNWMERDRFNGGTVTAVVDLGVVRWVQTNHPSS